MPADLADLIAPDAGERHDIARDEEIILRPGARDQAHLRVSCLPFASETQRLLGAVLVINDHTTLEHLQRQVRQADRLASIGTLASGMAHEIKNPLTALKTFTQLLPKRYNDAEFRHDFSGLAGSEIARIERIVNQLLAFARPAPLMIEQVSLHEIIDGAMRLVGPQASRQQVTCGSRSAPTTISSPPTRTVSSRCSSTCCSTPSRPASGGGWIELATEMEPGTPEQEPLVRLDVRDNGSGIAADIAAAHFRPVFHDQERGHRPGAVGQLQHRRRAQGHGWKCRAKPGKGTCFSMYLPVC